MIEFSRFNVPPPPWPVIWMVRHKGGVAVSKLRISSGSALVIGLVMIYAATRLPYAGKPVTELTDGEYITQTVLRVGGVLIALFAAAGLLHSLRGKRA